MKVGEVIQIVREHKNHLNINELANKANISRSTLIYIETNGALGNESEADSLSNNLDKVCRALDIPYDVVILFNTIEEDIPEQKRWMYNIFKQGLSALLFDTI